MKRANGTGTVKRYKDKKNRPWAAFKPSVMIDGKRKSELIGYYETKAEAEQALSLEQIRPSSALRNITLAELFDNWKQTRAFTDLSKQTQDNYNAAFKYMQPYHNKKFADLRQNHFQACIDNAIGQGRSVSTQNKIKILCSLLSTYAMVNDIVYKTYAVKLKTAPAEKKTIQIFTDFEIQKLFENDYIEIVDSILILIYTGMRISELLTLNKFQVNIDEMVITGGLKTDAGRDRIIPIHPKIQKYIRNRYSTCKYKLIENNGKEYTAHSYRKQYYKVLKQLGISHITPHKARHTFFSLMDRYCQDKKAMADVGGHTDARFTENVYVHPDIDRLRSAVNCIP